MALTIEDGTIVEDADSFATVTECRQYASSRGLSLPTEDAEVEQLLVLAWDYLFSIEDRFQGYRWDEDQEGVFPRGDIYLFEKNIENTIPKILKKGQCQLAVDANSNTLQATGTGREVKKTKVGSLEKEYATNGSVSPQIVPAAALTILDPLFKAGGGINLFATR